MTTNAQVALQAAATVASNENTILKDSTQITGVASAFLTWLEQQDAGIITESAHASDWPRSNPPQD